ncbi:unnamed protein product, partial [Ectocarpus sp. 12 AP-2014]
VISPRQSEAKKKVPCSSYPLHLSPCSLVSVNRNSGWPRELKPSQNEVPATHFKNQNSFNKRSLPPRQGKGGCSIVQRCDAIRYANCGLGHPPLWCMHALP